MIQLAHKSTQKGAKVVSIQQTFLDLVTLVTSSGTLVCCALPALFVGLGAGATFAGIVSHVPGLIWLSQMKGWLFLVAGIGLCIGGILQWRTAHMPCPVSEGAAQACSRTRRRSRIMYWISVVFFCVGGLFAYVLPWIGR